MEAMVFGLVGVAIFGTVRIISEGFGMSYEDSALLSFGVTVLILSICVFCTWLLVWRPKNKEVK